MGNGGDLGGNSKKEEQESVGSVAADPDNLENWIEYSKEAGRGVTSLRENCTVQIERVCPLCR